VDPREIDEVLDEHPAVATAAVVGAPHAIRGEEIAAAIVLNPGSEVTEEELQSYVREPVAAYKYSRIVWDH